MMVGDGKAAATRFRGRLPNAHGRVSSAAAVPGIHGEGRSTHQLPGSVPDST